MHRGLPPFVPPNHPVQVQPSFCQFPARQLNVGNDQSKQWKHRPGLVQGEKRFVGIEYRHHEWHLLPLQPAGITAAKIAERGCIGVRLRQFDGPTDSGSNHFPRFATMGNAKNPAPCLTFANRPPLAMQESPGKSIPKETGAFRRNQEFSFFPPPILRCQGCGPHG
jgi:hypothetical protein